MLETPYAPGVLRLRFFRLTAHTHVYPIRAAKSKRATRRKGCEIRFLLEGLQEGDDFRLHGRVRRGGRLIGDEHRPVVPKKLEGWAEDALECGGSSHRLLGSGSCAIPV